jgi:RHS repeat-associated protein
MQAGDLLRLGFEYRSPTINNNNGNVLSQTIARPGFSATQTYTYDAYNRIQKVQEGTEFRDFAYKEPGNLYVPSWSTGAGWAPGSFTPASPAWFNANGCLVNTSLGASCDAAGNQTAIGGFTFAYDAENRLVSSTLNRVTTNYIYDGEGRRVKKGSVVMVYDAFGRLAAEYGGTADPVGTEYLTADHLGSTRLVTSAAGAERRCLDYLPFGEQMTQGMGGRGSCYASANEPRVKFTGKERDAETGLDYFGARYFSGAQGRFTSPDNFLNDTTALDPQRWNLYAYTRNNPLRYVDPNGEKIYAGDLSDQDREELLKRINATYGCKGCVSVDKTGFLQVDTSGLSKQMLAATDYLTGAINSTSFFARVQVSNNDPGLAFGETRLGVSSVEWNGRRINASLIRLDFGDDRWIGGDAAARQTFLNTVFAHEVAHVFPTFLRDPSTVGPTGPVVDTVNRITDVLGEPRRTGYMSSPVGGHWLSLPFSKTTVDKNGQSKEKAVQIQWMRRNVGGRGVN